LKKGINSLVASIPTLPGGALKGGGKFLIWLKDFSWLLINPLSSH
jgi:hypothetical protein